MNPCDRFTPFLNRRRERAWRRHEARLLADKAAWWARHAEAEPDPTRHDEARATALMFAAVARAIEAAK
jgi:hypothetical protein